MKSLKFAYVLGLFRFNRIGLLWMSSVRAMLGKLGTITSVANNICTECLSSNGCANDHWQSMEIAFILFQRAEFCVRPSSYPSHDWLSYSHHWRLLTFASYHTLLFQNYLKIQTGLPWSSFSLPSSHRCPQNTDRILIGIFLSHRISGLLLCLYFGVNINSVVAPNLSVITLPKWRL